MQSILVTTHYGVSARSPQLNHHNHRRTRLNFGLEDLRSGRVRYLDALELETIIWLPEERVTAMLDPSHSRWRGEASGSGS